MHKLITIGTASGFATECRSSSCHLVKAENEHILLDCGEGAAGKLTDHGYISEVRTIILTHLHADHFAGIFMVLQNLKIIDIPQDINIYMPHERVDNLTAFLKSVYLSQDELADKGINIKFKGIESGKISIGSTRLKLWETDHFKRDTESESTSEKRSCFGVSIEHQGHNLVYTSDYNDVDVIAQHVKPDSTVLSECNHIDWKYAISKFKELGAKKQIFVHAGKDALQEISEISRIDEKILLANDMDKFDW